MSDRIAGGPIQSSDRPEGRGRWLPFWSLQVVELIVAFAFVDISIHVGNSGLLVAVAIALVALAATAQGPLGIFRICPPRLHLVLVVVTASVAAIAPVIPALRPDIEGIIVLEFGAVGLIRVATLTAGPPQATRERSGPAVIDATATLAGSRSAGEPGPSRPAPADATGGPAGGSGRTVGRSDRGRRGGHGTTGGGPASARGRGAGQTDHP
jgi:hypothetical protein